MKSRTRQKAESASPINLPDYNPIEDFGAELKKRRKFWRLSQRRLAEMSGTTQATIALIEAGQTNPTLDLMQRLASAMQTDIKVRFITKLRANRIQ